MSRRMYILAITWCGASLANLISNPGIHVLVPTLKIKNVMVRHPEHGCIKVAWRLTSLGRIDKITQVSSYVELAGAESVLHFEDLVRGKAAEPVRERLELIKRSAVGHLPEADGHLAISSWNGQDAFISFIF